MKEIELANYSTMFPGVFKVFVTAQKIGGKLHREIYFKCETSGERPNHEVHDEGIPEMVLSCSCHKNYSLGIDIWNDIAKEAERVPFSSFEE